MNKYNIGYFLSIIIFVIFQVLSIVFKFKSSNTWWAFIWLTVIITISFLSTIFNIKRSKEKRTKFIITIIPLSIMLIAVIAIIIGAVIGVPECQLPLY